MKKQWAILSATLVLLVMCPCTLFSDEAPQKNVRSFVVGLSLPLSGDMAQFGQAVLNAFEMAKGDDKELFGHIKFIYEDNQYSPTLTMNNYNKLVHQDHADLVYVWGDHPAPVLAQIAEREKRPLIAFATNRQPFVGMKYVLRALNSYEEYSEALMSYLRSKGYKRLGIVQAVDPYYDNLIDGMMKLAKSDESINIVTKFQYTDSDFKSAIAKLKKMNVDAIGVFLMPGQVSTFYNQAAAQHLALPSFGADVFESGEEMRAANGHMDGAVYAHNYCSDDFKARYLAKYGNDYQITYAATAYETARLIAKEFGIEQKRLDAQAIIERLSRPGKVEAEITGTFEVVQAPEGDANLRFPIVVKRIEGEQSRPVSN